MGNRVREGGMRTLFYFCWIRKRLVEGLKRISESELDPQQLAKVTLRKRDWSRKKGIDP